MAFGVGRREVVGRLFAMVCSGWFVRDGSWSSGDEEFGKSDEIVGGGFEGEHPSYSVAPAVLCLAEGGGRLDPAERLLDALSQKLADGVAGMPCGAAVDRRAAAVGIAGHMG